MKTQPAFETARITPLKPVKSSSGFKLNKLIVSSQEAIEFIDMDEIICIEAEGSYSTIFTTTEKYVCSKTLKELGNQLPAAYFLRCHRSYYVNLNFLKRIRKTPFVEIECLDGRLVPVSRNKRKEILSILS